ncbi:MAG: hypothetical protein LBQ08_02355 [Holosporaceae bacterium]|nr:hypothetical protein [Holosporaceae bacterium]
MLKKIGFVAFIVLVLVSIFIYVIEKSGKYASDLETRAAMANMTPQQTQALEKWFKVKLGIDPEKGFQTVAAYAKFYGLEGMPYYQIVERMLKESKTGKLETAVEHGADPTAFRIMREYEDNTTERLNSLQKDSLSESDLDTLAQAGASVGSHQKKIAIERTKENAPTASEDTKENIPIASEDMKKKASDPETAEIVDIVPPQLLEWFSVYGIDSKAGIATLEKYANYYNLQNIPHYELLQRMIREFPITIVKAAMLYMADGDMIHIDEIQQVAKAANKMKTLAMMCNMSLQRLNALVEWFKKYGVDSEKGFQTIASYVRFYHLEYMPYDQVMGRLIKESKTGSLQKAVEHGADPEAICVLREYKGNFTEELNAICKELISQKDLDEIVRLQQQVYLIKKILASERKKGNIPSASEDKKENVPSASEDKKENIPVAQANVSKRISPKQNQPQVAKVVKKDSSTIRFYSKDGHLTKSYSNDPKRQSFKQVRDLNNLKVGEYATCYDPSER